ncbi:MAG: NAD(P)/FAD-dependent oxidoreductase [Clostridia bacterium]|nr:NAD(P)/FAD-dependent oxidoreductase [Clostridia bacterium]
MFDVAIIGGGVVGGMIARTLSAYNLHICILEKERDVAMGATKANSAIVHAGFDAKEGSLKARLNVRGSEMMEQVTRELGVKYRRNGSLVIGFNGEDKKHLEELLVRGNENGVKGLRLLDRDEVQALEPNISESVTCALHAPTGAIVCPYELCIAAIGNAMDNGAALYRDFAVSSIKRTENGYEISRYNGETVFARYIVNAAGVFADEIARMAGDFSFSIHPRRGEYVLLDKECGGTVSHTIFRTPSKMGKGILVSPTVDNNLLLGPTSVDMEDKEEKETTAEGLALVMREASENLKIPVPFGKSITSFCGLRAVGNTGDFIINVHDGRFVNVAGIESPGLSASPAIAEYVLGLLTKHGLCLEKKADYNPIREPKHAFREASIEEKNAIIEKDPTYGRIICRCEQVTEGEILDAIRSNPTALDIDGVKRRTRSGMGRCQGGFCGPYVMELLAREYGTSMECVTKMGGGSVMVVGKTKGDLS